MRERVRACVRACNKESIFCFTNGTELNGLLFPTPVGCLRPMGIHALIKIVYLTRSFYYDNSHKHIMHNLVKMYAMR